MAETHVEFRFDLKSDYSCVFFLLWIADTHHHAVRADWHLSYDNNNWALVPAEHILNSILEYKDSNFETV